jgi:60 kDa SS-A/Ro ribonucleoprotein
MSKTYSGVISKKITPQSVPIPKSKQIKNSAGGYSYKVDKDSRLRRFLILGSEGGSYYASEQKLTRENAEFILKLIEKGKGPGIVKEIVEISESGRAPKNDPAIFALAICASSNDQETKRLALEAMPRVCRIGTHLFQFVGYVDGMRGWGRGLRSGVANWYESKTPDQVAYQAIKYQQRENWSHRDLLRKSHPQTKDSTKNKVYKWIVDGEYSESSSRIIEGFEKAKKSTSDKEIVELILGYDLPREAIPTQFLTSGKVWEALLQKMPMTAMIRNLATMTRVGILEPFSEGQKKVIKELSDQERITKSRVHPIAILSALMTYQNGKGERGGNTWIPEHNIIDALDSAFYKAFGNVEPCGKNILMALDVSASMTWGTIAGVPGLTPRTASAALALVTANVEPNYLITAFSDQMVPINISPNQRLDDVVKAIQKIPMGGTDCSLPMIYASQKSLAVDGFVILTDSESWSGHIHASQALKNYRKQMSRDSKFVAVGMLANKFTVSDPEDLGSLDISGFDTASPQIISDFIAGKI